MWLGEAGHGTAWKGLARQGADVVRPGTAWRGKARRGCGAEWQGMAGSGLARRGCGVVRYGTASSGEARLGKAWIRPGVASLGAARCGEARNGVARIHPAPMRSHAVGRFYFHRNSGMRSISQGVTSAYERDRGGPNFTPRSLDNDTAYRFAADRMG
jgi:hypothetical protein